MIAQVRRFVVAGVLCTAGTVYADEFGEAQALIESATSSLVALQSAAPSPDAETIARIEQEALNQLNRARTLFKKGGIEETRDADAAYAYGELLVRLGDTDLAVESLRNAHELAPKNSAYALGYGAILIQLGEGHEAAASAALRWVIDLEPDTPTAAEAHSQLAEMYRQSGLYDMTIESAESALLINPEHEGALFLKAVCLARLGRFGEANTIMDDVAKRAPALARDERGRLYDAVRDFERRKRWVANTAEEHAAYGKMLIRVNRLPDSVDPLRHSVRLNPDDAIVWNLLGSVYRQANRIDDARDAFERSLAIDPDQERTRQVLQQLPKPQPSAP